MSQVTCFGFSAFEKQVWNTEKFLFITLNQTKAPKHLIEGDWAQLMLKGELMMHGLVQTRLR